MVEILKYLAPIVAAFLTAIFAIIGLIYQNNQKLKQEKLVSKQAQYEKIIRNVFKLFHAKPGIEYAEALNEVENSWLYASDSVLDECYKILDIHKRVSIDGNPLEHLKKNQRLLEEFNFCLQNLYLTMRKDLNFGDNKNSINWPAKKIELFPLGILAIEIENQ